MRSALSQVSPHSVFFSVSPPRPCSLGSTAPSHLCGEPWLPSPAPSLVCLPSLPSPSLCREGQGCSLEAPPGFPYLHPHQMRELRLTEVNKLGTEAKLAPLQILSTPPFPPS